MKKFLPAIIVTLLLVLFGLGCQNPMEQKDSNPSLTSQFSRTITDAVQNGDVVTIFSTTFERDRAKPQTETVEFSLPGMVHAPFMIEVQNGNSDGSNRVSSAVVLLNGTQVFGPSDFEKGVYKISCEAQISAENVLGAELRSQPGGFIKISVTAVHSTVLYETDFSTDPAWDTNNPSRYYWDAATASYYTDNYTNSQDWATISLNGAYNGESFKLQFDVKPTVRDTGDVNVGLFDSSRQSNWTATSIGEKIYVLVGGYDSQVYVAYTSMTGISNTSGPSAGLMVDNEWHHIEISYDSILQNVAFTVMRAGNTILSWQGNVSGGFSKNINYLGASMVGTWVTSDRHEVAYIDNVKMEVLPDN
jgi:hypothetical protein